MVIRLFSLVLGVLAALPTMSQNISGKVVDANGEPLAFANVVLLSRRDSAFVKGAVSGADGRFTINSACNGGIIRFSSVGYKTVWKDCTGESIGTITMEDDTRMLGEVVVKSALPKTFLKDGGMTTTVAGTILEKAGTMEHLLDRIPNVTAKNGSVKVFGRGEPVIYINGRRMRDKSELDRLHSDDIKSVEVITNPGARYDASTKAVIRITTKKALGEGFGFDATAEGEYDEKNNLGAYGRLNMYYRKNGLELGAYAFAMKEYNPDNKDLQQITYLDKTWNQHNEIRQTAMYIKTNYRVEASYQWNDSNSIGANFGFRRNPRQTWNGTMTTAITQDDVLSENSTSRSRQLWQNTDLSSNIYYVGKIGKMGIDFNADWLWTKEWEGNGTDEHYQEVGQAEKQEEVNSVTSKYNRLWASKLVLTYPLWSGELSLGGEYSYTNRNSTYTIVPNYLADDDKSRTTEGMASAFITYNRNFGKLNIEAGLRYENIDFKYYDDGNYMAGQSKTYANWFPSLSLSLPVGQVQMQLNYAADITRPSYWALRSATQYTNRYTYESGNPFLISEIARNLSYDVAYKWISLDLTYTHTSNPLCQTFEVYRDNAAMGVLKTVNSESYDMVSAMLNLQPTFGFWHPSLTAYMKKQWFKMTTREGNYLDKPMAMLRFNNTFDTKLAMLSVMMSYTTKGHEQNIYIYKPMFNTDISISKSFMNDRLSLQLYIDDVLGTYDRHIIGKFGQLKEMVYDEFSTSKVELTVRYKFNTTRSKYRGTGAGQGQKNRM